MVGISGSDSGSVWCLVFDDAIGCLSSSSSSRSFR